MVLDGEEGRRRHCGVESRGRTRAVLGRAVLGIAFSGKRYLQGLKSSLRQIFQCGRSDWNWAKFVR